MADNVPGSVAAPLASVATPLSESGPDPVDKLSTRFGKGVVKWVEHRCQLARPGVPRCDLTSTMGRFVDGDMENGIVAGLLSSPVPFALVWSELIVFTN